MESIITKRTKSNTNIGKMLKIMIKKTLYQIFDNSN
jgi:hypothetical protein